MSKWIKKIFRSQVASSILYLILGICLVALPNQSMKVICMIFGGVLAALGIVHIVLYIRNKEQGFLLDLFSGALQLVLGGFLLFNPAIIIKLLPILLGAVILVDSIWTFQACLEMRKLNFIRWNWLMGVTVVFVILGIVMIVNPFSAAEVMIRFAGVVYLLNGVVDIFFLLFLRNKDKIISKMADAMIVDVNHAEKAGEVLDAEVGEDGKVVVEDVEIVPQPEEDIFDTDSADIIDVEVSDIKNEE